MASQGPGRRFGQADHADAVEAFGHVGVCPPADGLQQLTTCRVFFPAVRDNHQPRPHRRRRRCAHLQPRRKPLGDVLYAAKVVGKKADGIGKREEHATVDMVGEFRHRFTVRGRQRSCYEFMAERGLSWPSEPLMGRDIGVGNQRGPCAGRADRGEGNMDLAMAPGRVGRGDVYAESFHDDPLRRVSY